MWLIWSKLCPQNLRDQVIASQQADKRAAMMTWFENLMDGIERNLLTKNRDRFTQNLSVFRRWAIGGGGLVLMFQISGILMMDWRAPMWAPARQWTTWWPRILYSVVRQTPNVFKYNKRHFTFTDRSSNQNQEKYLITVITHTDCETNRNYTAENMFHLEETSNQGKNLMKKSLFL